MLEALQLQLNVFLLAQPLKFFEELVLVFTLFLPICGFQWEVVLLDVLLFLLVGA